VPLTDVEQAWDEVVALIRVPWEANTPSVTADGEAVTLGYPGSEYDRPSAGQDARDAQPWAWLSMTHVTGGQRTFGPAGQKRHANGGFVVLEIYAPGRDGLTLAHRLAKIGQNALKNGRTPNGLTTTQVRLNEIGEDGPWYHINVLADFDYDVV
jgi:hypothetical protein